ncbi:MNIO family bufferin maturase [Acanthopleuribacter pedis]|uniref:DUF692 domain-containing protein n=1 Tax=Acanthopleuribacter pedis TaxID=442870 RepID=A0A8J7U7U3_9BACT|nr:DUF692 domain-containing protein [Acanthopleuribacter pedis]MBO1322888.1 DUF692 domain-containing protein [Acanthopleuribacter pedis]
MNSLGLPNLGFGVGLRATHFPYLMSHDDPLVDWFEIISENFLHNHGYARHVLATLAEKRPVVMHGVSLNLGSYDPLNRDYLAALKDLANWLQPAWISDHLCWTGIHGVNSHDLLPLPLNEETLQHVSNRIDQVQEALGRPLILENPSSYLTFSSSTIPEAEFLAALAGRTGCGLLLDVNNVYVSATNHGFDAQAYIQQLPADRIVQVHLAGHTDCGDCLVDTHDQPVPTPVWELYLLAQRRCGGAATLLEWDAAIPAYEELVAELNKARGVLAGAMPTAAVRQAEDALSTPIAFQVAVGR